jgi:hypothetical protein
MPKSKLGLIERGLAFHNHGAGHGGDNERRFIITERAMAVIIGKCNILIIF